jgi:thiol-disulfide isomerase/thioredoxin
MKLLKLIFLFVLLVQALLIQASLVKAEGTESPLVVLKYFDIGSFEKIVKDKKKQDHLVVFWSITCQPCLVELKKISKLHKQYPEYQFTLVSTDYSLEKETIMGILQDYDLAEVDNWVFANRDETKLRYDIDSRWFGDLPRSYFFPLQGEIKRLRGALTSAELLALFQ